MRAGELGVEQLARAQAHLGEAGEVLGGRVQDPLGGTDRLVERGEVGAADRVDQPGAGALAAHLHEVGALAVAVARGALGVDRDRALARRRRPRRRGPARARSRRRRGRRRPARRAAPPAAAGGALGGWGRGLGAHSAPGSGQGDHALGQRGQPGDGAEQVGPREQVLADLAGRAGSTRRAPPSRRWPAGRPARRSSARPPGSRCPPRRRSRRRGPARASVSQLQPTSPSSGSVASSGSSSARAKVTARHSPPHGSGALGSCSRTKRPEARSSSVSRGSTTSAVRATAYGAMRCGAGTSVSRISGRRRARWRSSRARANSGDSRPVTVRLDTTSM